MKKQKRPMLLLEIMIAFSLILLCAFPLLYPHIYMIKAEKDAIRTIELDRLVGFIYADLVIKLYRNEIPWEEIDSIEHYNITQKLQANTQLIEQLNRTYYTGHYWFEEINRSPKKKKNSIDSNTHHLLKIVFSFTPSGQLDALPIQFERSVYIKREFMGSP